jgi:hypothetical protein
VQSAPKFCEALDISAAGPSVNPLGIMRHTHTTLTLRTGYQEFHAPEPLGIGGLCQVKPGHVDILAIASNNPGEGNFSRFLDALEPQAGTVTFWSMMSETLYAILERRGYNPILLKDKFGETRRCMSKTLWGSNVHAGVQAGHGYGGQGPLEQGSVEGLALGDVRPTGGT